jgi:hypothetical protein
MQDPFHKGLLFSAEQPFAATWASLAMMLVKACRHVLASLQMI